jgi:CHAD domain-containing protein
MKKKEELKYLDREWKEMNAYLNAFLETGDQEALHQFRVQIKKLKAMLVLIGETSKKHSLLKVFRPVRKIFKYAGNIRDAHTNLGLSARYQLHNEAFETGQQKIIEDGTSEFRQNKKKFARSIKHTFKQLKKKMPKVGDNAVAEYYKNQLEEISVNLIVSGFTEDMHTNRKLIKILVYNHELAGKALDGSLNFNTEYLDELQHQIGKWHDNLIAAQLFSTPELDDKPAVAKINRKNAGVKRSISAIAEDFLSKATTIDKTVSLS